MPQLRMYVVLEPDPGTTSIIVSSVTPAIRGVGDTDYLCGDCGVVLVESVARGQIVNVVFKCPMCEAHNQIELPGNPEPVH